MESTARYFVIPYVNELFHSIIARYQAHVGVSWYRLSRTLFGKPLQGSTQVSTLPRGLKYFVRTIGKCYSLTEDVIINHHSLNKAYDYCCQKVSSRPERPAYFNSSKIPRVKFFQYCPECFLRQKSLGQEAFWNRVHNIEDINLCLEHNTLLQRWIPPVTELDKRKFFNANDVHIEESIKNTCTQLVHVTRKTIAGLTLESNRNQLIKDAINKGLLLVRGPRLEVNKDHYVPLLSYIKLLANAHANHTLIFKKLKKYLSARKTPVTIYHYYILESYIDNLKDKPSEFSTFKNLACINKICPSFDCNSHTNTKVVKYTNRSSNGVVVNCTSCGYDYFKNFDLNKPITVRDYGPLVLEYVKKWPSIEYPEMSIALRISINTLRNIYITGQTKRAFNRGTVQLSERKAIWLQEISSRDFKSIGVSLLKHKRVYKYLKTNDPVWLKEVNRRYRKKKKPSIKRLIAPKSEDEIILDIENFKNIHFVNQTKRRVTKTFILNQENFKYLTKDLLKRLPKVQYFLQHNCESIFEFTKRKLLIFLASNIDSLPTQNRILWLYKVKGKTIRTDEQNAELISLVDSFYLSRISA